MKENKVNLSKEVNVPGIGEHTNGNCISVLCITTGNVYTSLIDAANGEDCSYSALSACLRGKIKTCHGKEFVYAHKQIEKSEAVLDRLKAFAEMEADALEYRKLKAENDRKRKEIEDLESKINKSHEKIAKLECNYESMQEKLNNIKDILSDERDDYNHFRFLLQEKSKEYGIEINDDSRSFV